MSLSSGSSDASGVGRRHSPFDIAVLAVSIVLLGFFVNTLYFYVARACPDPNEGGLFDTWQRGLVVRGGWPTWEVIVPYFFYHYLDVKSVEGLQSIGAFCSLVGAVVVNYLVYFKFGLDGFRRAIVLLAFNAAILSGNERYLLFFARWGILAYPLRVFAGSVFIYLLVIYSREGLWPGRYRTIALGVLASFLVYAHYILVLPICAVFGALCITQIVRRQVGWAQFRKWMVPLLFVFVLPVAVGIVVNLTDPQSQMKAPRGTIKSMYFFYNDSFEKTLSGYGSFLLYMSRDVAHQIAFPHGWTRRALSNETLIAWIPLVLISIGIVVSFFRKAELRFVLATFVVLDLFLRLGANFGGWFPYGNVRYILSQVFPLQLMAGFGIADLLAAAYWLVSRLASMSIEKKVRSVLAYTVVAVLAGATLYFSFKESVEQRNLSLRYRGDAQIIKNEFGAMRDATILLTDDREALLIGALLGKTFFEDNKVLYLPGKVRGAEVAWDPKRIEEIQNGIKDKGQIYSITFRKFLEDPYGPTGYGLITSSYSVVEEREMWDLYFTTWRSINPKLSVSP